MSSSTCSISCTCDTERTTIFRFFTDVIDYILRRGNCSNRHSISRLVKDLPESGVRSIFYHFLTLPGDTISSECNVNIQELWLSRYSVPIPHIENVDSSFFDEEFLTKSVIENIDDVNTIYVTRTYERTYNGVRTVVREYTTLLHEIVKRGNTETMISLFERGALLSTKDHRDYTPINYACIGGSTGAYFLEYLQGKGFDILSYFTFTLTQVDKKASYGMAFFHRFYPGHFSDKNDRTLAFIVANTNDVNLENYAYPKRKEIEELIARKEALDQERKMRMRIVFQRMFE